MGVLMRRGSYYLGVCVKGPFFRKPAFGNRRQYESGGNLAKSAGDMDSHLE